MGKNRIFLQLIYCFSAALYFTSFAFISIDKRSKYFLDGISVDHTNDIVSYHTASPLTITKISSTQLPN